MKSGRGYSPGRCARNDRYGRPPVPGRGDTARVVACSGPRQGEPAPSASVYRQFGRAEMGQFHQRRHRSHLPSHEEGRRLQEAQGRFAFITQRERAAPVPPPIYRAPPHGTAQWPRQHAFGSFAGAPCRFPCKIDSTAPARNCVFAGSCTRRSPEQPPPVTFASGPQSYRSAHRRPAAALPNSPAA